MTNANRRELNQYRMALQQMDDLDAEIERLQEIKRHAAQREADALRWLAGNMDEDDFCDEVGFGPEEVAA